MRGKEENTCPRWKSKPGRPIRIQKLLLLLYGWLEAGLSKVDLLWIDCS
jgi:hypothetical protein